MGRAVPLGLRVAYILGQAILKTSKSDSEKPFNSWGSDRHAANFVHKGNLVKERDDN